MARESCKERSDDLIIACRDPSKIFREVREDVLAAVRKCSAANRGISVMKVASDKHSQLRQTANARKPVLASKTRAIGAFMHLLDDAQQHNGAACAWEVMAADLATRRSSIMAQQVIW